MDGQWLYRNVQVHDRALGVLAAKRKEELQKEMETQLHLDRGDLEEKDQYLLEINLEDVETTSDETQEYWLLAISAAREARLLWGQETNNTVEPT